MTAYMISAYQNLSTGAGKRAVTNGAAGKEPMPEVLAPVSLEATSLSPDDSKHTDVLSAHSAGGSVESTETVSMGASLGTKSIRSEALPFVVEPAQKGPNPVKMVVEEGCDMMPAAERLHGLSGFGVVVSGLPEDATLQPETRQPPLMLSARSDSKGTQSIATAKAAVESRPGAEATGAQSTEQVAWVQQETSTEQGQRRSERVQHDGADLVGIRSRTQGQDNSDDIKALKEECDEKEAKLSSLAAYLAMVEALANKHMEDAQQSKLELLQAKEQVSALERRESIDMNKQKTQYSHYTRTNCHIPIMIFMLGQEY